MSLEFLAEQAIDEEVLEIADGRREGRLQRHRAIALLARSRPVDGDQRFGRILDDETAETAVRVAAAKALAYLATPEAVAKLVQATRLAGPAILAAVVTALAQVGTQAALPPLVELQSRSGPFIRRQAAFAATLIAHRLDVSGHDWPLPPDDSFLPVPAEAPRVRVINSPNDGSACVQSLRHQSLKVEFAERPIYEIVCDRGSWLLVLTRQTDQAGRVEATLRRKSLMGVLVRRLSDGSGYRVGCYILTAPAPPHGLNILIPAVTSELYWGGKGSVQDGELHARLQAVAGSGALPIDLVVRMRQDEIEFPFGSFDHSILMGREPLPS